MTAFFFRARLDRQMLAVLQRLRHRHGHFLLLRPILEVARLGKNSAWRKYLFDLYDQVATAGLRFNYGNHLDRSRQQTGEDWQSAGVETIICGFQGARPWRRPTAANQST
jgi:hypothetical protein